MAESGLDAPRFRWGNSGGLKKGGRRKEKLGCGAEHELNKVLMDKKFNIHRTRGPPGGVVDPDCITKCGPLVFDGKVGTRETGFAICYTTDHPHQVPLPPTQLSLIFLFNSSLLT